MYEEYTRICLTCFFERVPLMVAAYALNHDAISCDVSPMVQADSEYALELWLHENCSPQPWSKLPESSNCIVCNECYNPLTDQELEVYPLQWQHSGDMYCTQHENREQFKQTYTGMQWDSETGEYREQGKSMAWDKMLDSETNEVDQAMSWQEKQNSFISHYLDEGVGNYNESDEVTDSEAYLLSLQDMDERIERQYMG